MSTRKAKTANKKNLRLRKKMAALFDRMKTKDMLVSLYMGREEISLFPSAIYKDPVNPIFGPPITTEMLAKVILPDNPLPTGIVRYVREEEVSE